MRSSLKISAIFVFSLLLVGCGSKGDLYLSTPTETDQKTKEVKPIPETRDEKPKSTKPSNQPQENVNP